MPTLKIQAQRSYNMSKIRSRNTGPEIQLRSLLISKGLGDFEMHFRKIPGNPDFYFPGRNAAIFLDGCFWHGCKVCYQLPKTNREFWNSKIKTNIMRDQKVNKLLSDEGVAVLRIREHEFKKNPEVILKKIEKQLPPNKHPKVLDLFAGAGGLSEGFLQAGCEIVGHIEMDQSACDTLKTRMLYHALKIRGGMSDYKEYITGKVKRDDLVKKYGLQKEMDSVICAKIGSDNYAELIAQIKNKLVGEKLDIIVGGPPCQAYSYIGRARDKKNMKGDGRNFLYRYYVEFLKGLRPKIFVFENVPGLESAGKGKYLKDMLHLMKKTGYAADYKVLNAADFGVPQNRKRVILVGWSRESGLRQYPEFPTVERSYTVKTFLGGLPKLASGKGKAVRKFDANDPLLEKLGIVNSDINILMDHVARPHTGRDLEIYRLAVKAKMRGQNIKYNQLPKRLKTHSNETGFLDRFKVVDLNSKGSHTVVAHIAKDGHFYIHPDIKQNRSLTVREAARLQTFPDDYKFEGERGPQFRQIGNAVPPLFARVIASTLLKYI